MTNALRMLLVCVTILGFACDRSLSENQARNLAEQRIAAYAQSQDLERSVFGEPEVSSEAGFPWIFDYTSKTTPRHLVRIYFDSDGGIELNRMVE